MEAKALVAALLSETASALDGFPAAVLVDEWLQLAEKDPAAARRTQRMIAHILAQWATTIEHDLSQFPPPTLDALQAIRRRMVDSQVALLRLQRLLVKINGPAPAIADAG
jgi:KaiC/GvpD/RAD55 family RecA-like ATPase